MWSFPIAARVVKSWTLKNYKDSAGKPLELVNQTGASKVGFPFSFAFRGEANSPRRI